MHPTLEQKSIFGEKETVEKDYLHTLSGSDTGQWQEYFRFNYGIGAIEPCLLVDINMLLASWRAHLSANDALLEEEFVLRDCIINEQQVTYKNINARHIIFCDGVVCSENPYFNRLPWSKDKGEALIVAIPGLPKDNIYNQGLSILHWKDDLFWVGATHDWKYTDLLPTPSFRKQVEGLLDYWLKLPYTITGHMVAQRPVNVERKPFVGMHPVHKTAAIFNGMGTKGCSVAPYFAQQFAQHLIHHAPLMPDVDVSRFTRILSR